MAEAVKNLCPLHLWKNLLIYVTLRLKLIRIRWRNIMQKGARKWIEYYWNYVNSDKYKEEKIKRKAEYEKATHDSDKEENIQEEEQAQNNC